MNAILNNKVFTAPMLWTAGEAEAITNGISTQQWVASGVAVSSQNVTAGDLYIHLDMYDEVGIIEALRKGASAIVVEAVPEKFQRKVPFLIVEDAYKALLDLAAIARLRADQMHSIAIAGSVGKSCIRSMLGTALSRQGVVHSAQSAHLSTHLSLALSLSNTHPNTKFGLYELGVERFGEAFAFAQQSKPSVAIITNVFETSHDHFSSLEEVTKELGNIFETMDHNGTVILNADCPHYPTLVAAARTKGLRRVWGFGGSRHAHARLIDITEKTAANGRQGQNITVEILGERVVVFLPLEGRHMVDNLLATLLGVLATGASLSYAVRNLERIHEINGRGKRKKYILEDETNPVTAIDETLHFCPVSIEKSLLQLAKQPIGAGGRKIAILGDFPNLPDSGAYIFETIETLIDFAGVHAVYTVGSGTHPYAGSRHFETYKDLVKELPNLIRDGDSILVKGNIQNQLWHVLKTLEKMQFDHQTKRNDHHKASKEAISEMPSHLWRLASTANDG